MPSLPSRAAPVADAGALQLKADVDGFATRREEASCLADEEARKNALRAKLLHLRDAALAADPAYMAKPLHALNAEAVAYLRRKDAAGAVAAFAKLFRKARAHNLTHVELYVCHGNRSAAYLELGLFEEALWDACECQRLAEHQFERSMRATAAPAYVRAFARRGAALLGLRRPREAAACLQEGLQYDPASQELREALDRAEAAVLQALLHGQGLETPGGALLPAPDDRRRITYLPAASPLHCVESGGDSLPAALLTPFQAESDPALRDTYTFFTIQADVRAPQRHLAYLGDLGRWQAWATAVTAAIGAIRARGCDARVLDLAAGAGLVALHALRAGAAHVTCVDRWLYLAGSCHEALRSNGVGPEHAKVVYKRPTDLQLRRDVPVCCNVVVADLLEDGVLAAGLVPALRHAVQAGLATPDAIVLPRAVTVYCQAIELRTASVCGLDMGALNRYRHRPIHLAGSALAGEAAVALSEPMEVWHWTSAHLPEALDSHAMDVTIVAPGLCNAVRFWFELDLGFGVTLDSSRGGHAATLRPAIQYLAGEMAVDKGMVVTLVASHNTAQLRFHLEEAELVHLAKRDSAFPPQIFSQLADGVRLRAFDGAIERAVQRASAVAGGGEVHVLDIGSGSGILAMMAARAGAASVVACEVHPSLVEAARVVVASNRMGDRISVVHCDAGRLERGKGVRAQGVNVVVADIFDATLLGDGVLGILEHARKMLMQPRAVIVPCGATLYGMGVEIVTTGVGGFNMATMNKYRWDADAQAVYLDDIPHRVLTRPFKVFDVFFDGRPAGRTRESVIELDVVQDGILNAVVTWFDLHLDDQGTITSAPDGIGTGGQECQLPFPFSAVDAPDHLSQQDCARGPESIVDNRGLESQTYPSQDGDEDDRSWPLAVRNEQGEMTDCGIVGDGEEEEEEDYRPCCGQALYYLERAMQVDKQRSTVKLLAKREGDKIQFSVRNNQGMMVAKAPWKIQLGGGASIESPHFQRVHYCELLLGDFIQRLQAKRFPPIENDLRRILAHCGPLFLDPVTLWEVYHRLVVLESVLSHGHLLSSLFKLDAASRPPLYIA